jgi:RimJ/RimL family protein N-acetyltransferase
VTHPALPSPTLTDGHVVLRPWQEVDAAALAEICRDPTILRWTNVPPRYTAAMARTRIASAEVQRQAGSGAAARGQ